MPLYNFECPVCHLFQRRLLDREEARGDIPCKTPECSGVVRRVQSAPAMEHLEVIDNGLMQRRVERFVDAKKLTRDRSKKDYRKPD